MFGPERLKGLRAALLYWALVFAVGFVFGAVRTLWLAPLVGALAAVAIELPLMLAASWLVARRLIRLLGITAPAEALIMGFAALALLLGSEAALAWALARQGPGKWAAGLATPPGALGLAGQVLFALIPLAALGRRD